ncbi:MAG: hypothetical protein IPH45_16575 [Bacteroidales bacterium]|nr:hypothetical protein [Bacteroidales bacterium]
MKKIAIKSSLVLLLFALVLYVRTSSAQEPPHPPTSGHGQAGNQNPTNGGAPVGEGVLILSILGLLRAGYKSSGLKKDSE